MAVSVVSTLQGVENLKPMWKQWQHNPQTDFDYYVHRLRTDPTIVSPCVLTVCREDVPQAVLVGRIRKQRLSATISSVNVRSPKATVLEVVAGGRMGNEGEAIDDILALHLRRIATGKRADLLLFQRLSLHSKLFRALQQLDSPAVRQRVTSTFYYSLVRLSTAPGQFAPSLPGKHLREGRRKARILERSFPGKVKVSCYSDPVEFEHGIREASVVAVTTWQHYLGQDFLGAEQAQEHLRFVGARGLLRVYVMYINDTPCAFLMGQLYNDRFYCLYAGYNPTFAKLSVGCVLTYRALANLAAIGVREVDLGEGDQEHNRRLGCPVQEEGTVHIYCPTARGIALNAFFGFAQTVRVTGRRTIAELRLNRLRKSWLRFLTSRWMARNGAEDLCL
jgi:hypothetical protein